MTRPIPLQTEITPATVAAVSRSLQIVSANVVELPTIHSPAALSITAQIKKNQKFFVFSMLLESSSAKGSDFLLDAVCRPATSEGAGTLRKKESTKTIIPKAIPKYMNVSLQPISPMRRAPTFPTIRELMPKPIRSIPLARPVLSGNHLTIVPMIAL